MGWKKRLTLQSRRGYERSKAAANKAKAAPARAGGEGSDHAWQTQSDGGSCSHSGFGEAHQDDSGNSSSNRRRPQSLRNFGGRRDGAVVPASARGFRRSISTSNLGRKVRTIFQTSGDTASPSASTVDTARDSVVVMSASSEPPAARSSQQTQHEGGSDSPSSSPSSSDSDGLGGGGGGGGSRRGGSESSSSSDDRWDPDALVQLRGGSSSAAYVKTTRGSPSLSCSMLNASNHGSSSHGHSPTTHRAGCSPRGAICPRRASSLSPKGGPVGIAVVAGGRGGRPVLRREPSSRRESFANREAILTGEALAMTPGDFDAFVRTESIKAWLMDFREIDPRSKILNFFNDVAQEGGAGPVDFDPTKISPILRAFYKASVFSVWRPTSTDAIRRMMMGEGVGKGLDIKGKSARRGKLSAFVPFLQIYKEEHKREVRTLRRDGKIRVYFDAEHARDHVVRSLRVVGAEMDAAVQESKLVLLDGQPSPSSDDCIDDDGNRSDAAKKRALEKFTWEMDDSSIDVVDSYAPKKYGMDVPERLFWEGMVVRQSIHRENGSPDDIGRPSLPSFQDMNFGALRRTPTADGEPRAVVTMYVPPGEDGGDPMSPLNLVMAYEEDDPSSGRSRVIPVVSDFDCFLVGTRGVKYEEKLPDDQLGVLQWSVSQAENILKEKKALSWTERWLDVLKTEATNGFHPEIPPLGYSDPKTNYIFKHAIQRLSREGAVRHGAECFNFYFPQDLDEEFLVISDDLPGRASRWRYVNQTELQDLLRGMIGKGYTFPLNPKWILCDKGWKAVYDQLVRSQAPNVQDSLDCWYPRESGLRETIEQLHRRHPNGFERLAAGTEDGSEAVSAEREVVDGTTAMDLAEEKLKQYLTLQRAKGRLMTFLTIKRNLNKKRGQNLMKEILARAPNAPPVDDL